VLKDVGKRYGDRWVFRKINLELKDWGMYAVLGDNGSGKTTLLKISSGLLRPSEGDVYIFGSRVGIDSWDKSLINVLLHENIMYDELSLRENLDFYLAMYGFGDLKECKYAFHAFEIFGLKQYVDYKLSKLSYGWRKRVNIVRALLNHPKILFLDEPTIGLDMDATKSLVELLNEYSKGSVVLFTVSDLDDLKQFLDMAESDVTVYRLDGGGLRTWSIE